MYTETIEKTFPVPATARLFLSNIRGSVELQPGAEGVIQVTAVKHLDSGDAGHTEIVLNQADDGSMTVETSYTEGWAWFFFLHVPCKVDYVVRVPRRCELQLSVVSSRASVAGLSGELAISTVSGPLDLNDLSGTLRLKAVSGQLRGENLSGPLEVETVSGDVRLRACRFPRLRASTVSGLLAFETPLSEGPYRFHAVSGDVRLVLPLDSSCTIYSSSLSGRVSTGLPITRSLSGAGGRTVEVQGGGSAIRHHSVSGDLTLLLPEGAAEPAFRAASDADALVPVAPAARREVLERIARGEISAEEGLKILAA